MYNWLVNHKIFGAYIYAYLTYKAISKKIKIRIIFILWSTLIVSIIFVSSLHIRLFLVAVGIGVTVHVMMLKTLSLKDMEELNDLNCKKNEKYELQSEK